MELPWKDPHLTLPDNYQLCLWRLYGLVRRLKQDPDVLHEYDSIIRDQIQQGIVETTESSEEANEDEKIHYLPHHAVVQRDKETTKVQVVYDTLAHSDGHSLNDCLHAGPKFEQQIMDILLRFHVHCIAVTADIEKAFLMVSVAAKDCDVLRVLWFDDVFADQPHVVELRFTCVVFGVSSSPFLLNARVYHHQEQYTKPSQTWCISYPSPPTLMISSLELTARTKHTKWSMNPRGCLRMVGSTYGSFAQTLLPYKRELTRIT